VAASAIPAVLSALLSMAQAAQASTLAGVEVVDGPPTLVPASVQEALVFGSDWDPNEATIATSVLEPFSDFAQLETITMPGAVVVKTGEPTTAAPTARMFAILTALKALLVADPTLGGVVGYSLDAGGGGKAEQQSLAHLSSLVPRRSVAGGTRCVGAFTISAQAVLPD
jgi:hypothetical protein